MTALDVSLRLVGAFYVLAGIAVTRAGLTSYLLEHAIATISMKKADPRELHQTFWLLLQANTILAGGLCLMFLADLAVPFFVLAALGQAAYFGYLAPAYFDRVEPPDAAGRRASLNAFVLYVAATALVVWASYTGRLQPWSQITWLGQVLILAALVANIFSVMRVICFPAHSGGSQFKDGSDDAPAVEPLPASGSTSFKLMAEYQAHPLWALDESRYGDVAPAELALSQQLTDDLDAWAAAYTASFNPDDPATSRWSEAEQIAHAAAARPLALRLAQERPDLEIYLPDGPVALVRVYATDTR